MKRISGIFALILGLLILAACNKEKINNQEELDPVDPTGIHFVNPPSLLMEGDQRTLEVAYEPSDAKKLDIEISSGDSNVASVAGFRLTAVGAGNTTITARIKGHESISCSFQLSVEEYSDAVSVTAITPGKSSVVLCDLNEYGEGESIAVPVTLSPSNASWQDVTYWSSDSRLSFQTEGNNLVISVDANTTHKATPSGTSIVNIKAKRGGKTAQITVDVRGHIYGVSIPKLQNTDDPMLYNGTVLLVKGKTFSLDAQIAKTGTLKDGVADKLSYTVSNSSVLSVTSDGTISVSGTPLGGSSSLKVTVSVPVPGVSSVQVPVKTYYEPTGYTLKLNGETVSGTSVLKGGVKNMILSITATPDKALCDIRISGKSYSSNGTDDLENVTVTNNQNSSSKIEFNTSDYGSKSTSDYIQIGSWINGKTTTWTFQVNAYSATDIKEGDYVYYVKNDSKGVYYYFSDGGLRAHGPGFSWVRRDSGNPLSSSDLIGIIYDVTSGYDNVNGIKLRGFRYYGTENWAYTNGKLAHAAVISAKDPKAGTYTWEWSSSYFDIDGDSNWDSSTYGKAPKESATYSSYLVYEGLRRWNAKVSESKRVKAIYSVDNYNDYNGLTENAGRSGSCPLRKATSSQYGSTGWVLPLKSDMQDLEEVLDIVKTSITRARSVSSSCADVLAGPYWLANYSKDKYTPPSGYSVDWAWAYCFDVSQNDKYPKKLRDITTLGTRPIVFI